MYSGEEKHDSGGAGSRYDSPGGDISPDDVRVNTQGKHLAHGPLLDLFIIDLLEYNIIR